MSHFSMFRHLLASRFVSPFGLKSISRKLTGAVTWLKSVGTLLPKFEYQVTPDRAILYALGIGCSQSKELRYLYENHSKFSVFPTFSIIPAQHIFFQLNEVLDVSAADFARLLHGETYLEVLKPLRTSGHLVSQGRVTDIVDKKSGVLIIVDVDTMCAKTGEKLLHNQFALFFLGSGNFGGPTKTDKLRPLLALTKDELTREPDAERRETIGREQNAIYRLSGDRNPLHIDSAVAEFVGFPRPILHGLCSLGYAARHVADAFNKAEIASVKVRFSKPVLPGQTLRTKMWKRSKNDVTGKFVVLYQTSVEETGEMSLSGHIELFPA